MTDALFFLSGLLAGVFLAYPAAYLHAEKNLNKESK